MQTNSATRFGAGFFVPTEMSQAYLKGLEMTDANQKKLTNRPMLGSPRAYRAIEALLKGDVSREQLDRIAGASNSPALVAELRKKGLTIPCERVSSIDRDGNKTRHGVYSFTVDDKILAKAWLAN